MGERRSRARGRGRSEGSEGGRDGRTWCWLGARASQSHRQSSPPNSHPPFPSRSPFFLLHLVPCSFLVRSSVSLLVFFDSRDLLNQREGRTRACRARSPHPPSLALTPPLANPSLPLHVCPIAILVRGLAMLSPLSPQPSLPSPTFTPQASPSPSSAARVRTSSRRKSLAVSVSLARAFLGQGLGPSSTVEEGQPGGSDFSSGGHSRSGTDYGEGSGQGSGASSRSRTRRRRHLELSEGDLLHIGHPLPGTTSHAPLQAVVSPPLPPTTTSVGSPSGPTEPSFHRLEIVRQLGTGSYAVVYLVKEVLDQPTGRKRSDSGSEDLEWDMEGEDGIVGLGTGAGRGREYGREFGQSRTLHSPASSRPLQPDR